MKEDQYFGETDREFSLRSQLIVANARIEALGHANDGRGSYEDLCGWLSEALGKIAILEEQRDATHKQMDDILIRRNKRIEDLEKDGAIKHDTIMQFKKRIDELEVELGEEKDWIEKCHQTLATRDNLIEELETRIRGLEIALEDAITSLSGIKAYLNGADIELLKEMLNKKND